MYKYKQYLDYGEDKRRHVNIVKLVLPFLFESLLSFSGL